MKVLEKTSENITIECPHCEGDSFIFGGTEKQIGLFKNHELWTCMDCRSTIYLCSNEPDFNF